MNEQINNILLKISSQNKFSKLKKKIGENKDFVRFQIIICIQNKEVPFSLMNESDYPVFISLSKSKVIIAICSPRTTNLGTCLEQVTNFRLIDL